MNIMKGEPNPSAAKIVNSLKHLPEWKGSGLSTQKIPAPLPIVYHHSPMPWVEHFNLTGSEKVTRVIEAGEEDPRAKEVRESLKEEFKDVLAHSDVVVTEIPKNIRGPSGVAKIELLPGSIPKKERPFRTTLLWLV